MVNQVAFEAIGNDVTVTIDWPGHRAEPEIGYAAATEIAKEALETGRGVAELVAEKGLLPTEELAKLLKPETLARLRCPGAGRTRWSDGGWQIIPGGPG